mmetsp:Transcript_9206/g.21363  ORF Transcript_9206/g.21363 Transcript_9206/m.21363 type:complete len:238 (-) Transcript_9206:320-1033(-)
MSLRASVRLVPTVDSSERQCACRSCESAESVLSASSIEAFQRACCLLIVSSRSLSCWFCRDVLEASDSARCCRALVALHCFSIACPVCSSLPLLCSMAAEWLPNCRSEVVRTREMSSSSACMDARASCECASRRSSSCATRPSSASTAARRPRASSSSCERSSTTSSCNRCCAELPFATSCASTLRSSCIASRRSSSANALPESADRAACASPRSSAMSVLFALRALACTVWRCCRS